MGADQSSERFDGQNLTLVLMVWRAGKMDGSFASVDWVFISRSPSTTIIFSGTRRAEATPQDKRSFWQGVSEAFLYQLYTARDSKIVKPPIPRGLFRLQHPSGIGCE
jgi:hypothetical protein